MRQPVAAIAAVGAAGLGCSEIWYKFDRFGVVRPGGVQDEAVDSAQQRLRLRATGCAGGLVTIAGFDMNRSIPKKDILIQCGPYFVRTIRMKDASERWAGWLSDTEATHMLNSPAVTLTQDDVVKYIKSFDQRSHLLLGVFERSSSLHIGITRLDIEYGSGIALLNILIGEKDYRHKGVASTIAMPCIDYFFRNPNLNAIKANVLARNSIVLHFMTAMGWKFDDASPQRVRSATDNSTLDVRSLILSREAWSAWRGQTSG